MSVRPDPGIFPPNNMKWHANATKRFATPFVGVEYDRIDFDPIMMAFTAVTLGYTIRQFNEYPEFGIMCVAHVNELFDVLPVAHWFYSNDWIDALGAELYCTDTLPWIVKEPRPIRKPEDIDKLEVPSPEDLTKCLTYQLYTRAYDYIKEHAPHQFVPIAYTFCLFAQAAELYGPEKFFILCRRKPELAHKLMRVVTDTATNGVIALANRYGSALMTVGSVLDNSDTLSPKMYEEFSFNYIKKHVRDSLRGGGGPQLFYHLCGNHCFDYKFWKEAIINPFTVLHIGYYEKDVFPADLLKKEFGNLCTIMLSVDTKLMIDPANGPKIYEQAKKQLLAARDSPRGCVLGTSCETPAITHPSNIAIAIKACRDFGTYGTW